ncbi:hypothetical protein AB3A93_004612 [Vibrio parahaemolyticus]|uniref:hypothetical protein n=1 Tax=Vibrio parahaemolyticus TaxID=670 RepID=UPI00215CAEC5|nr:hypothetical protein [Vibrio parahaemolyticus]ELB2920335.1 hypothetical protein [Vibrio parahaemolyticus]MCR9851385.1 hypothetical protein [Vibrio parahaemolyticus]HCM0867932.1 hypothetical protein [Vibrio parahaemolyticus]
MSFTRNSLRLEKMQVWALTDLDENVMMDLLAGSSVYTEHVKKIAIESAEGIQNSEALTPNEKEQQLEFLADDMNYAKEAQELAEELAIIGLFKTLEIRIAKATKASKLLSNNKVKELYITDKFIEHFSSIGIDLNSVAYFDEYKELKLLNNCLKHSGEVNQSLEDANPTVWTKGKKITDFATHFRRLLRPNLMFLNNVGAEIRSKL